MIANSNNYLLLKQMLVVLETVRLNGQVSTQQHDISINGATSTIKQLLNDIETDFTIPYALIANNPVGLCLRTIQECIQELRPVLEEGNPLIDMINETSSPEAMFRCIHDFPVMKTYYEEHAGNVAEEHFWDRSREVAGELINTTSEALATIQDWVDERDSKPLCQLIVLSNCIELVDRLFAFINDHYGASNVVSN
jgi:hypothetical protein